MSSGFRRISLTGTLALGAVMLGGGAALAQPAPVCVPAPAGMVGWWPGDGNTSDLIGGNPGTWNGTTAYTTGEVDEAFSLNGASYVDVPSSAALSPTAEITIDAWIAASDGRNARIVDKITAGGTNGYLLDINNGYLRFIVGSTALTGGTSIPTSFARNHVVGTYDGATMRVYLDGALDGSLARSGAIPTNVLPVRIGADSTGVANQFVGWIDEVEIFNRALSLAEIQGIYNAGSAGKCKIQEIPALSPVGLAVLGVLIAAAAALLLGR